MNDNFNEAGTSLIQRVAILFFNQGFLRGYTQKACRNCKIKLESEKVVAVETSGRVDADEGAASPPIN